MAKDKPETVEIAVPDNLDHIIDSLRNVARFDSDLADRFETLDHPASVSFREVSQTYLDIADAFEAVRVKRYKEAGVIK